MHNCPKCFWAFHQGHNWEQATSVAAEKRIKLCGQLGWKHVLVPDDYQGGRLLGLGAPSELPCKAVKALGGGLCWFSTMFYLLVGQKSGKANEFRAKK